VKLQVSSARGQAPAGTGVTREPIRDGVANKQSQFARATPAVVQTNPIAPNVRKWARAEKPAMEPGGAKDAKQTQSPRDTRVFHYSIVPVFPSDADRAKRTQFRGPPVGSRGRAVRNKANSEEFQV
jgi:hypothetical protein